MNKQRVTDEQARAVLDCFYYLRQRLQEERRKNADDAELSRAEASPADLKPVTEVTEPSRIVA